MREAGRGEELKRTPPGRNGPRGRRFRVGAGQDGTAGRSREENAPVALKDRSILR